MFDKRSKRVLYAFGIALLLIAISEMVRPKPIDWSTSYTARDKIPFGSFVLYKELPKLFPTTTFRHIEKDPFEFLAEEATDEKSAYLFINENLFFDANQVAALQDYVTRGNTAFLSARDFGHILEDTLSFQLAGRYTVLQEPLQPAFFGQEAPKGATNSFQKGVYQVTFSKIDTVSTQALGYFKDATDTLAPLNFIRVPHGKGDFLIHTLPEAFSNYYLLKGNHPYTAQLLSYLDASTIYWDGYLKAGRRVVTTPLRFVLTQSALTWSFYILLLGLLVFVVFTAKRQQRIIPQIEPLGNSSIAFTKAVGQLYFQHKDYASIINKKITYFLEEVRSQYYLDTSELDDEFIHKLSVKSGKGLSKTKKLVQCIRYQQQLEMYTEQDLKELNKRIQEFRT
jgi:hypothetical protein